jgi:hypothetical protein
LTQEEILKILGFSGEFAEISFGPFTGNATLLNWFSELCNEFGVNGSARVFWKVHGKNKTFGLTDEKAKAGLKKGILDPSTAFIYHCHNHYMAPIGFEESSSYPANAYQTELDKSDEIRTHILIGDSSKTNLPVHCVKFEDISKDLHCKSPEFFNIRHTEQGIQTKNTKSTGNNINCIMIFENMDHPQRTSVENKQQTRVSLKERIAQLKHTKKRSSAKKEVLIFVPDVKPATSEGIEHDSTDLEDIEDLEEPAVLSSEEEGLI